MEKDLKNKFSGKKLIVPAYASRKKEFYSFEDLSPFGELSSILGEVNEGESYITPDGISFLKEAYGFDKLAQLLFNEKWFEDEYKNPAEIFEWLTSWEKESKEYKD